VAGERNAGNPLLSEPGNLQVALKSALHLVRPLSARDVVFSADGASFTQDSTQRLEVLLCHLVIARLWPGELQRCRLVGRKRPVLLLEVSGREGRLLVARETRVQRFTNPARRLPVESLRP